MAERPDSPAPTEPKGATRRRFLQYMAVAGAAAQGVFRPRRAEAVNAVARPGPTPPLPKRKLGRTDHEASRLVFGCGASLALFRKDELLEAALEAGVNTFDVGFRAYYRNAEEHLGPFAQRHRDDIFLISKAFVPVELEDDDEITTAQAKSAAAGWSRYLDESLRELGVDHVDAYYQMAAHNPSVVTNDELYAAFEKAKQAGKVRYLGLSTHRNAQDTLMAAADSGRFDLAMIAITPAGWYDWDSKGLLEKSPPMKDLRPVLDRARAAGIGLVGMKAGRYLKGRKFLSWGNAGAFDAYYEGKLAAADLSAFQKSYAFVLEHGLDVVNADIQDAEQLQENLVAAATSGSYFA